MNPVETVKLIRYAIDQGLNYLDLGYPFDLNRQRHLACLVGEALQDGYLEKVKISLTLPSHLIQEEKDFEFYLKEQLTWLRIGKADFCLFGRLNRDNWPELQKAGALAWADDALGRGRVDNIGFSFHDHFQILRSILNSWNRWRLCQLQFSYMDVDHDPGISGIQYAAEQGLAVVAADPLKNGRLARVPPPSVAAILRQAGELETPAELGLRFVWNYIEVSTAVLDIRCRSEIEEAVRIAGRAEPNGLTIEEEILISRIREQYLKSKRIDCSSCRPCMPCPEGIDVPRIFEVYNDAFIYEDAETARTLYRSELHNIGRCTQCGICRDRCVKRLPILEWLDHARSLLQGD
ncbi:MAG: aldo/keto reductase [Acidobacteria bacterium]|nr:aldo/keto reductase [Acidobacteriota bacterium]